MLLYRHLLIILNFFIFTNISFGQDVISEYIATDFYSVRLHRNEWALSYPIINLNSEQQLQLSFDELYSGAKNYFYSITLCDAGWQESVLMKMEYCAGTLINPVIDYAYSFNTTMDYVHYNLVFPENGNKITLSGNYIIKVFENYEEDKPVIIKKFMVVETVASIKANIRHTPQSLISASFQEIKFEVEHPYFDIANPIDEISATIIQNGRTDNVIKNIRPQFFRKGFMDFNYIREITMEGGNEFRHIDLRSRRFIVENVSEVKYIDPFYHVFITPDNARKTSSYRFERDLNGRYFIEVTEYNDNDTEADYFFVHFTLKEDFPEQWEKVYITGDLTYWLQNQNSEMTYNISERAYEQTLLMKQGFYNYHYLTVEKGDTKGALYKYEGNNATTENDYLILIYYKGIRDRCHRLIGAETFNSIK
jgi:hypothetical protein